MSLKYHLRLLLFTTAVSAIIAGSGLSQTAQQRDAEIEALQRDIDAKGYHWTAKRTWVTNLTDNEFQIMLGLRVPEEVQRRAGAPAGSRDPQALHNLPENFDWRNWGIITPVKNQQSCGSCWDFCAIGALEAVLYMNEGVEYDLSEQQILSCQTPGYGCDGGWMPWVWGYIRENGAVTESCFPYQASDGIPCTDDQCAKVATSGGWIDIPNDVESIKAEIIRSPVISTFVVYSDFRSYGGGCYEHVDTDDPINHCVLLIGWNDDMCGGTGAWLAKNSWGASWGMDGFFWIKYGTCKIGTHTQRVLYDDGLDIAYFDHSINDPDGDGDGRIDPGEEISLAVELKSEILAPVRTDISATLTTSSKLVEITQDTALYPPFGDGDSGTGTTVYELVVSPFTPPGIEIEFVLDITADDGYANSESFAVRTGDCPILLVDDDGYDDYNSYFETALLHFGFNFDIWNESHKGFVSAATMSEYDVIVWMTGRAGDIEYENREALRFFLIGNGKLFITGEDIGWALNHDGIMSKIDFYENYLHAEYIADDSGFRTVSGIAGDPIGDGLSFGIGAGDGSGMQDFPSEIEPVTGGIPIFEYSPGIEAGVRYEGMGKVVYLAFGLEAANTSAVRDALMSRALDWLNGGAWPDNQQPQATLLSPNGGECIENGGACEIRWNASDDTGVTSIDILRSYDAGETFPDTISSGEPNDGIYTWSDPDSVCSMSRIRIVARDAAGFAGFDDSDFSFSTGGALTDAATPHAGTVELFQNIPNPFNPVTVIGFSLPAAAHVNISVYDVAGRCMRVLLDRDMPAGRREVTWNGMDSAGSAAASGIYFCRLVTRERTVSRKMVLLR